MEEIKNRKKKFISLLKKSEEFSTQSERHAKISEIRSVLKEEEQLESIQEFQLRIEWTNLYRHGSMKEDYKTENET